MGTYYFGLIWWFRQLFIHDDDIGREWSVFVTYVQNFEDKKLLVFIQIRTNVKNDVLPENP